mgnify:CR=1 FL=1
MALVYREICISGKVVGRHFGRIGGITKVHVLYCLLIYVGALLLERQMPLVEQDGLNFLFGSQCQFPIGFCGYCASKGHDQVARCCTADLNSNTHCRLK